MKTPPGILFDENGCPADPVLAAIAAWPLDDVNGLLAYVRSLWDGHHGSILVTVRQVQLFTEGYPAHERVITALHENTAFWRRCWDSSSRGSHTFSVPRDQPEPRLPDLDRPRVCLPRQHRRQHSIPRPRIPHQF